MDELGRSGRFRNTGPGKVPGGHPGDACREYRLIVDLESGTYAMISEVPNASSKNMLKKFTVPDKKVIRRKCSCK